VPVTQATKEIAGLTRKEGMAGETIIHGGMPIPGIRGGMMMSGHALLLMPKGMCQTGRGSSRTAGGSPQGSQTRRFRVCLAQTRETSCLVQTNRSLKVPSAALTAGSDFLIQLALPLVCN